MLLSKIIPKIKQNKTNDFKFIKNEKDWYVDIEHKHTESLNYQNLFLILKSYVISDEALIDAIYINSSDVEDTLNNYNLNLFHKIEEKKLKKIKFLEFIEWYDEIRQNDHEYIKNLKYYGFRVVFNKQSSLWKEDKIYPIFPWIKNFKNIWIKKKEINFKLWLYNRDKKLYKEYTKTKKN